MPGKSYSGVLPALTTAQERLAVRLGKHVAMLSGEIGERNLWRDGTLDATAGYIEETLQSMGYAVSSQAYTVQGTDVRNLEAVLDGTSLAEEIVLIGAHYDTVRGSPGANDNASGVAALLEIARLLAAKPLARKLVRQCLGAFRRHSAFPSEGVAAPGLCKQRRPQRHGYLCRRSLVLSAGCYSGSTRGVSFDCASRWLSRCMVST